jgi:hypothetical protein
MRLKFVHRNCRQHSTALSFSSCTNRQMLRQQASRRWHDDVFTWLRAVWTFTQVKKVIQSLKPFVVGRCPPHVCEETGKRASNTDWITGFQIMRAGAIFADTVSRLHYRSSVRMALLHRFSFSCWRLTFRDALARCHQAWFTDLQQLRIVVLDRETYQVNCGRSESAASKCLHFAILLCFHSACFGQ